MEQKSLLPKSEKLNVPEISKYFENIGYKLSNIAQPWRFLVAQGEKEGRKIFLKVASTPELSDSLINEQAWYQKFIPTNKNFYVPQPIESGRYGELEWYSVEFVEGKVLCDKTTGSNTELLEQHLDNIVDHLIAPSKNVVDLLPKDRKTILKMRHKATLKEVEERLAHTGIDVIKFQELLESKRKFLEIDASHGDFVPWHILLTSKNKLCIIDPEHASFLGLRMYDAAYFFHRLYGTLERPDIAQTLLDKLLPKLSEANRNQFEYTLIFRIAGGFWEALDQKWIPREPQDQLLDKLIQKSLWD